MSKLTAKQKEILEALRSGEEIPFALRYYGARARAYRKLEQEGLIAWGGGWRCPWVALPTTDWTPEEEK